MSKSILVIDTPEDCFKCDLKDGYFCGKTKHWIDEDCFPKPDWCPLKDVTKKTSVGIEVCIGNKTECVKSYVDGYNACIDEILKGANGNEQRTSL